MLLTIIYSIDESTRFLSDISNNLKENHKDKVTLYRISPETENVDVHNYIKTIQEKEVILFLGHGGSSYLCRENKIAFITKEQLHCFDGKSLFCLSCRSNEFLHSNFKKNSINNALGFGNLPTDWDDISGEREFDANAYENINKAIVLEYCQILVELVVKSFNNFFDRNLNFEGLNYYFRLHLNKKINDVILRDKSNQDNRILADLLYDIKSEMRFF